mgnify:CR=1 FL=1
MTTWTCWRDPAHDTTELTRLGWPECGVCGAGPSYPDRFEYVPNACEVAVYVPAPGSSGRFAPRSAVVGYPTDDGQVRVYFEGWVYGPAQYGERDTRGLWEAGVDHAAGRMIVSYPTVATGVYPAESLIRVGTHWPKQLRTVVDDEDALTAWLNAR